MEQADERGREREPLEDTQLTPAWLREYVYGEFPITIDAEGSSLMDKWIPGLVFHHPPHDEAQLWCEKAAAEIDNDVISVLLLPAVFNSIYWRSIVYKKAAEIRILACPIKLPGKKKQIVSQMALVVFAKREPEHKELMPNIFVVEPENWKDNYYKRQRNLARFGNV